MTHTDLPLRLQAFCWLDEQTRIYGEVLPRKILEQGMIREDKRIPFVGPQGIFKPQAFELPLSITTSPNTPYPDKHTKEGYLLYSYRGTDPEHRDNKGLRQAMIKQAPLIYFFGITPGKYLATWPVFIAGDDPNSLIFRVAVDDKNMFAFSRGGETEPFTIASDSYQLDEKRRYLTVQTRHRLHQEKFRERVLQAYLEQCAMCRLRHPELLEATHIIPDAEPEGEPAISNGIALCNLHHVAFDRFVLGIRPDYTIEVRQDVLREIDGPMLQHGLQGMHNQRLFLPTSVSQQPDVNRLAARYSKFKDFVSN